MTLYSTTTTNNTTTYSQAAISQCMVLVVDSYTDGKTGKTSSDYGGGMMGVSAKSENINYNVLLNASIPGTAGAPATPLAPAYVLDDGADGLTCTIGQTHTSGDGFAVVNLQPVTAPLLPELTYPSILLTPNTTSTTWAMPTVIGTFTMGTSVISVTAAFELDTGIDGMLVAVPSETFPSGFTDTANSAGKAAFVDGIIVNITVPGTGSGLELTGASVRHYTFTTGSGTPDSAPAFTTLMPPPTDTLGDMVRINTGIHPLIGYQYLYDAQNGVIGMKSNKT
ncbi:hypothetical protein [Nitrospirillum sp. BR 11163]|uniref:hypothetical protein n=1 Tax=Nitrospirillum sp. BR 11163 TaxID=3104323 RepID=UPI002AFEF354|nr:hypothetical protein [Nitrospirillum sp. BR 11163]MEA1676102.1 hypothetical protein [Nitrospirillum sp. BR 11163]